MRILITGAGQLGSALAAAARERKHEVTVLGRDDIDLEAESWIIEKPIRDAKPQLIFHTAALTKVNYCEEAISEAFQINGTALAWVEEAASFLNSRLVYFSTDYVFDGSSQMPMTEDAVPKPQNIYGKSKLDGEEKVARSEKGHIVRTSGVFGPRPDQSERNFFRAIFDKLHQSDDPIEVVEDQFTAVTYAPHLAAMLFDLLPAGLPPVVHLTSAGKQSWYGWARELALAAGFDPGRIVPVPTDESSPVRRPRYSVLGSRFAEVNRIMGKFPATKGIADYVQLLKGRI